MAESRVDEFDLWGNAASSANERGVVTQFVTDVVTGGVLQRVDDATGMALVTDFTLDNLGRAIQSLGPSHTIDLGGVATVIRTTNWWGYQDAIHQVWAAHGYANSSPHAPREGNSSPHAPREGNSSPHAPREGNHHAERDAYYGPGEGGDSVGNALRAVPPAASAYAFTLVNPVSITTTDDDSNLTDQIQAIRATSGPLSPTDS